MLTGIEVCGSTSSSRIGAKKRRSTKSKASAFSEGNDKIISTSAVVLLKDVLQNEIVDHLRGKGRVPSLHC
jgi:hypothetical protein